MFVPIKDVTMAIIYIGGLQIKTGIECDLNGPSIQKDDVTPPINYLERVGFVHEYPNGCSNVASGKWATILLKRDRSKSTRER
ncbi:hypothetical protein FE257_002322 [Aspergillus nanangensis]|uniref:Uncharacterized protein n=1 Tax=Aspergillus nanangensis TaxID=2582783 RepID=A0AAD4CD50_ASPNN|nr:hypothetical protein FE257_002322 [Aspergillus nanangensis]